MMRHAGISSSADGLAILVSILIDRDAIPLTHSCNNW
jgi:hypothetical protein